MYENAGRSIKSIVKVCVVISMVCSVIGGLLLMIAGQSILSIFLGLLVIGIGCFGAWLSGLTLYAYGEIADRLVCIDEKMDAFTQSANRATNYHGMQQTNAPVRTTTAPVNVGSNSYENVPTWKRLEMERAAEAKATAERTVFCEKCGHKNTGDGKFCVMCGHDLNS